MNKYNGIIILGPTASGKTAISIKLAKLLNGEIINADSTQVYKKLKIGTAKITKDEMEGVKHHLLSFLNPDEEFSVSAFKSKANKLTKKMLKSNITPVIVGGTGFYIDSLINNYNYSQTIKNDEIREKYFKLAEEKGNEFVYNVLMEKDKESAQKLHFNDIKRVVRALEVFEVTGKTKSELNKENALRHSQSDLKPLIIGLNMPRELLYSRINLRTDIMINNGLIKEVRKLYNSGYSADLQSIKSIGYKELYDYFENKKTLEEVTGEIKQATRNYAKRQITWFKRNKDAIWFDVSKQGTDEIVNNIISLYNA